MALRMLVYAGLLWQHLLTEKRLPPGGAARAARSRRAAR
jgi:hypothetical protein